MWKWLKNLFRRLPKPDPPIVTPIERPPEPPIVIPKKREKYALIVGINNYLQPGNDLLGCVYDKLTTELIEMFGFIGYRPNNIKVLINEQATTKNVISNLKWLVSHENAELVFQNSSHGTQIPDINGDEVDGYDEALVTYDGILIDDTIGDIFDTIPESSFLTFICDTCFSGTPSRSFDREHFSKNRFLKPPIKLPGKAKTIKKIGDRAAALDIVVVSACTDRQTAADAYIDGIWQGAFTWALKKHLSPKKTWAEIYPDILKTIKDGGFGQTPQLKGLDTRLIFGGN